jgi:D-alanyl-D-alanine carboxypeptidase/D-alanyl-D-alanine-endopeptidase (penicillin-binding protein 4)
MTNRRKPFLTTPVLLFLASFLQACFLTFPLRAAAISPEQQLLAMVAASPDLPRGHIGFDFQDLQTGNTLAQLGAQEFFTPASNAKLYTTALAIVRLGVTYRFKTIVKTSASLASGEIHAPDAVLVGGGDPNLSGRALPFFQPAIGSEPASDPLDAVNKLADQIVANGIRFVDGDVVGDDTRYPFEPYPDGWTIDDSIWDYGAPVSALCVNDNSIHLTIAPSSSTDLAAVTMQPEVGDLVLLNQVITVEGKETHVSIARPPGSNELILSGTLGRDAPAIQEDVAVSDPALFAAEALRYALEQRGISIRGEARGRHRDPKDVPDPLRAPRLESAPSGTELATVQSAPLSQVVQVVNKVSQNLHAEMLLREVAYATRSVGTLEAGRDERKLFLAEAGLDPAGFTFADGSGLARQDLTTPDSTVKLLRYMWARPEREAWIQSLPVGHIDGTLQHRLKTVDGAERVHAKTGSLSHVTAMSGYLQTHSGRWIVFSMMANAELNNAAAVRSFFDSACAIFLQQ